MFMPAGDLTPCPVSNVATHNLTAQLYVKGLSSLSFHKDSRERVNFLKTRVRHVLCLHILKKWRSLPDLWMHIERISETSFQMLSVSIRLKIVKPCLGAAFFLQV